jgi:predicted AlkP superfamily pyrophosphatase or phosphodiesterase
MEKLLLIQVAALGYDTYKRYAKSSVWKLLETEEIDSLFPAVTCSVQGTMRTAVLPEEHGMISNGFFDRTLKKAFFWEQASSLYQGERIWNEFRKRGGRVGQICWQQSLGGDSDFVLSPAPIHKHHGGMIQDFYSRPDGRYQEICKRLNKKFNLMNYWGAWTSINSSRWIVDATIDTLKSDDSPELLLTYIPHLDYDLQRFGPYGAKAEKAFFELEKLLEDLLPVAIEQGYTISLFGDYAITEAKEVLYPNQLLRQAGMFNVRHVKKMVYPDLYSSIAFALVDHQVAHIYIDDCEKIEEVRQLFCNIEGVEQIHIGTGGRAGELVLEASAGYWFAYPWWNQNEQPPDYATHVDIHNKPGFDPCELFSQLWPPFSVTQDTSKIRGTHGIAGTPETTVFFGTSEKNSKKLDSLLTYANVLKNTLKFIELKER